MNTELYGEIRKVLYTLPVKNILCKYEIHNVSGMLSVMRSYINTNKLMRKCKYEFYLTDNIKFTNIVVTINDKKIKTITKSIKPSIITLEKVNAYVIEIGNIKNNDYINISYDLSVTINSRIYYCCISLCKNSYCKKNSNIIFDSVKKLCPENKKCGYKLYTLAISNMILPFTSPKSLEIDNIKTMFNKQSDDNARRYYNRIYYKYFDNNKDNNEEKLQVDKEDVTESQFDYITTIIINWYDIIYKTLTDNGNNDIKINTIENCTSIIINLKKNGLGCKDIIIDCESEQLNLSKSKKSKSKKRRKIN